MIKSNYTTAIYACLLSLVLLVPAFLIPFTDHDARQRWERRKLSEMPQPTMFWSKPKEAFAQFGSYVDDHVGGGMQIIRARRKFYLQNFGVTGDLYIKRNASGALFLTSPFASKDRNRPFSWWQHICINLQNPRYQQSYIDQMLKTNAVWSKHGAKVVFSSVPTKPVLLSNELPNSTPNKIVEACNSFTEHDNHILEMKATEPSLNLFHPFSEFKSRMNDHLFFPSTAYHWAGESAWVFVEAFAEQYDLRLSRRWPAGPCEPALVNWDIGRLTGVGIQTPGCERSYEQLELSTDEKFNYPLQGDLSGEFVTVAKFENPHALNKQTAIMISNSFGPAVRRQFASLFDTTYHLNLNRINGVNMQKLMKYSDIMAVDYVVVVIADFHYPGFLRRLVVSEE